MEVFNLEILAKEKEFVHEDDPFLTCSTREAAKGECYVYLATYMSQTLGKDFSSIFKECKKAENRYQYACIQGVGTEAMKRNMNDPLEVLSLCKQAGSSRNQEACVFGVVTMYMNQKGSLSAGNDLCEIAPKNYQTICEKTVSSKEKFFR